MNINDAGMFRSLFCDFLHLIHMIQNVSHGFFVLFHWVQVSYVITENVLRAPLNK